MSERKEWRSTSPSQLSRYRDCKRQWFRESVLGERSPSSPAAELGSKIHSELEEWLMNATPPVNGTARAMMRHLPEGGSVSPDHVEQAFDVTPPGWAAAVRGRIDLIDPRSNQIIDHKTTASLNYAKTEHDLETDTQAVIYSAVALHGALGIEFDEPLKFTLLYGTTRGRSETRLVSRWMTRESIAPSLEQIKKKVAQQKETSQALSWREVEPSYSACDKWGGCPFRADCTRAQRALITVNEPSQEMVSDYLESLASSSQTPKRISFPPQQALIEISPELDLSGSAYINLNPPDGLPDGEELPEEEKPQKRLPRFKWKGKGLSAMKAPELIQALDELTGTMSPETLETYKVLSTHINKNTMKANHERLQIIHQITYGMITPKEPAAMNEDDDLFSILNTPDTEPQPEPEPQPLPQPEPQPEPEPEPEPLKDTWPLSEISRGEQEAASEITSRDLDQAADQAADQFTLPMTATPTPTTILIVDGTTIKGESSSLLSEVSPLIKEIEARRGKSILSIPYDEGWKELGARIDALKVWSYQKNIVTIQSTHPLHRHCSHILEQQADIVIKGTR